MSILDTKVLKKDIKHYLIFSLFILLFGFIYELFSHGIYTPFMYLAFMIPLLFGVLLKLLIINNKINIPIITNYLFNTFINTITLGSIIKGVLIIYGTTNKLLLIYLVLSGLLLLISIIILYLKKDD